MLLADYSLTVKEVAERLNFSSEYYFSHFFRNAAGISPTEFRLATRRGR
jgi:AraC-like DNA-binding protein